MSLRDQFKKANLLSDKDSRRLAHEARVERTEKGQEALDAEAAARKRELEQLQAKERERTRKEQDQLDAERKREEELQAVRMLVAAAKKPGPGAVKFYFEAGDGTLPWLEVSPREAQEVQAGALCVVRGGAPGTHTYRLLPLESTKRVARTLPDVIVHAPRGLVPR